MSTLLAQIHSHGLVSQCFAPAVSRLYAGCYIIAVPASYPQQKVHSVQANYCAQAKWWLTLTGTFESEPQYCCLELSGSSSDKKAPVVTGKVLGLTSSEQQGLLQQGGFIAAQSVTTPSNWLVVPVAAQWQLPELKGMQGIARLLAAARLMPCQKMQQQGAGGCWYWSAPPSALVQHPAPHDDMS